MKNKILLSLSLGLALGLASACQDSSQKSEKDAEARPGLIEGDKDPSRPEQEPTGPGEKPQSPRAQLLLGISEEFESLTSQFLQASEDLASTSALYCASLSTEDLLLVQAAWRETAKVWEQLELRQVGPLKEAAGTLKFKISSWPEALNTCRIDLEVMSAHQNGGQVQLSGVSNRQGLGAIEYLLFEPELKTSCAASNPRLEPWKSLSEDAKRRARCGYVAALTQDLVSQARTLSQRNLYREVWMDDAAKQKALQELFENLFYGDQELKNLKLAGPAGLDPKYCVTSPEPCLDRQQYLYSGFALTAIQQNVRTLAALYRGTDAPGFLDLVEIEGGEAGRALSVRTEAELQKLENLAAVKAESLQQLIGQEGPAQCAEANSEGHWFCAFDASLRRLASDLKREFTAILSLKAASSAQGDND